MERQKVFLTCTNHNYDFNIEINVPTTDREDIFEVIMEASKDEFKETFSNILDEAREQYPRGPIGWFDLHEIYEDFYKAEYKFIEAKCTDTMIGIETKDGKYSFSLKDCLKYIVQLDEESEQANCDISAVIETSLMKFETKGFWHYGFFNGNHATENNEHWPELQRIDGQIYYVKNEMAMEPIIWFGIEGDQPKRPWIINRNMGEDDLSFWHSYDYYDAMCQIITNCDDAFLTWYFFELGCESPDIDSILKKCPVKIDEGCSTEEVKSIIDEFFYKLYQCKHQEK